MLTACSDYTAPRLKRTPTFANLIMATMAAAALMFVTLHILHYRALLSIAASLESVRPNTQNLPDTLAKARCGLRGD
jgi:hypothetical protein